MLPEEDAEIRLSQSEYWDKMYTIGIEGLKIKSAYSLLLSNLREVGNGNDDKAYLTTEKTKQPMLTSNRKDPFEKALDRGEEQAVARQEELEMPTDEEILNAVNKGRAEKNTMMNEMIESDLTQNDMEIERLAIEAAKAEREDERKQNKGKGRIDDTNPTANERRNRMNRELPKATPVYTLEDETPLVEATLVEAIPVEPTPPIETVAPTTGGPSEPINLSKKMNDDPNKQLVTNVPTNTNPTTIDMIPDSRLSSDNKNEATLKNDITYFFKNFPKPLVNLRKAFTMMNKFNLPQLIRLHKRIVAILQPNKVSDKKVGVVIDAEEYIRKIVGETMIDNAIKGYSIPNLEPIGNRVNDKDKDIKDIGSYEVKRGPDGGLNSQKEPIYRYIPTTQEETLEENEYDYKSGPKRLNLPPTKMRNLVQTGKRQVRNNPFLELKKGHRLNVLL
jgi:hypothetical protein